MTTIDLTEESTELGRFIQEGLDVTVLQGKGLGHDFALDFHGRAFDREALFGRVAAFYTSNGYEQPNSRVMMFIKDSEVRTIFLAVKLPRVYADIFRN